MWATTQKAFNKVKNKGVTEKLPITTESMQQAATGD